MSRTSTMNIISLKNSFFERIMRFKEWIGEQAEIIFCFKNFPLGTVTMTSYFPIVSRILRDTVQFENICGFIIKPKYFLFPIGFICMLNASIDYHSTDKSNFFNLKRLFFGSLLGLLINICMQAIFIILKRQPIEFFLY